MMPAPWQNATPALERQLPIRLRRAAVSLPATASWALGGAALLVLS